VINITRARLGDQLVPQAVGMGFLLDDNQQISYNKGAVAVRPPGLTRAGLTLMRRYGALKPLAAARSRLLACFWRGVRPSMQTTITPGRMADEV
jgi:hypothetical protein